MSDPSKPVQAHILAFDDVTVKGLRGMPDYKPMTPELDAAHLLELQAKLTQTMQDELAAEDACAQARRAFRDASHEYHNAVVAARAQVIAQYGPDSAEVALIGLTRKSERKRPARRKKAE